MEQLVIPSIPSLFHGTRYHYVTMIDSARTVKMVPRGLEPRTLRLLAVRSNQLSYETHDVDRWYQVFHELTVFMMFQ